jgi:hypothetical protein
MAMLYVDTQCLFDHKSQSPIASDWLELLQNKQLTLQLT